MGYRRVVARLEGAMATADSLAVVHRYFALVEANEIGCLVDEVLAPKLRMHFDSDPGMSRDEGAGIHQ